MSQLIFVGKHHHIELKASSSKPIYAPTTGTGRPFVGLSSDNTCMVVVMELEWIGELLREAKQSVLLQLERRGKEDKDMSLLCLPLALACHWKFGIANCHDGGRAGACMHGSRLSLSPQTKGSSSKPFLWSARKSSRYLFLSQGPAMAMSGPFTHSTSRALLSLVLYCQGKVGKTLLR